MPVSKTEREYIKDFQKIKLYINKSTPLRISSPYISQEMLEKINKEKEKFQRIEAKEFKSYVINHNYEKQYVPNYVTTSPSNDCTLKFRETKKSKWINKKGFVYLNGKDLLLKHN